MHSEDKYAPDGSDLSLEPGGSLLFMTVRIFSWEVMSKHTLAIQQLHEQVTGKGTQLSQALSILFPKAVFLTF